MEKSNLPKKSTFQIVTEILILISVFSFIAYHSYNKIDALLKESLEESVALTAEVLP